MLQRLYIIINYLRFGLHILFWKSVSEKHKRLITADLKRYCEILRPHVKEVSVYDFVDILVFFPEFRNLFYYRVRKKNKWLAKLLGILVKPQPLLSITVENLGKGCFIQHGFSTRVGGKQIGENFWVNQNVTIGYSNATDSPIIGDNVRVTTGAVVIGAVKVGDNAIVGANAVVVKDVPANAVVGGVPAKIIKYRDGKKY